MTWSNLSELLCAEKIKLGKPPLGYVALAHILVDHPDALSEWEQKVAVELNAAIRVFSRTRKWPELTDNERTLLYWRLDAGINAADLFSEAAEDGRLSIANPMLAEEDLIEWILSASTGDVAWPNLTDRIEAFVRGTCIGDIGVEWIGDPVS